MGPLSYMRSIDRNVVMRRMPVQPHCTYRTTFLSHQPCNFGKEY